MATAVLGASMAGALVGGIGLVVRSVASAAELLRVAAVAVPDLVVAAVLLVAVLPVVVRLAAVLLGTVEPAVVVDLIGDLGGLAGMVL